MLAVVCTLALLGLTAAATRWSITRLTDAGTTLTHLDARPSGAAVEAVLVAADDLRAAIDARAAATRPDADAPTGPERSVPDDR